MSPARPELLVTERLHLRRPIRADLPAFHDIHAEDQPSIHVAERVGMQPIDPVQFRGQPSVLYSTRAPPS